ncbi:hypothetical protein [Actinoallomurus iriomotensis]|uniref:Phage tail protein n=1 Tax=Actinoallomurus iriomotensis TaxID=478107 RepID=A0A9W6RSQ3_9ACTN|nr:hypothetical protein [Actinoallomurus iriomotensis]GLY81836.1 hypothetical protein Airi01_101030 [Actinoallomurus iriomotensis]
MSATPIPRTKRFFAPGITKIVICTVLNDYKNPTRSEIDGGKEVSGEVSAVNGFNVTSNMIDAPDYGGTFTSQNSGRTQAADSSLTFYQDKFTDDARRWLSRGTTGFVIFMWGGDVPDQLCDVFPFEVASVGKQIPENADADMVVAMPVTAEPAEDVAIPAAA